jgi:hypothetical protein
MEKTMFEQMGGIYHKENGYLIPNLTLPPEEEKSIGIWGQRHLWYIRQHKRLRYSNLLTTGKLNSYLADIDEQAKEMFFRLVEEYADRQGVTEQLKADKPLEWVQRMNNIRNAVEEVIHSELICA